MDIRLFRDHMTHPRIQSKKSWLFCGQTNVPVFKECRQSLTCPAESTGQLIPQQVTIIWINPSARPHREVLHCRMVPGPAVVVNFAAPPKPLLRIAA